MIECKMGWVVRLGKIVLWIVFQWLWCYYDMQGKFVFKIG